MPVGKIIQWSVSGITMHPFHVHINAYQILNEPTDTVGNFFRAGDWHDTIVMPDYRTELRFQTDRFTGPQVVHCHELAHEDVGMIAVSLITGTEGTRYDGAESIDATCFKEGSSATAPTILSAGTCGALNGQTSAEEATHLCYGPDCHFMVSFKESSKPNHMEFTLRLKGHAWLGLGVSQDGSMTDATSIVVLFGEKIESHVYKLLGRNVDSVTAGWMRPGDVEVAVRERGLTTMVVNVPYTDR